MTAKYFAILTNYGAAQLANAVALGTQMHISAMAVGDGGGTLPVPDPAQTKLVRETRRAAVNQVSIDEKNPNFIIAEQVIPENEGGWFIREIGLFDDNGGLIAVGNAPETYKPNLQEGSGRTQVIQMVLMVSSTKAITLKVDPSVVLATRDFVTKSVAAAIHESEAKTAKIYATKTELSSGLSGKQPTGDYATRTELSNGLSGKQPAGDYALRTEMSAALKSIETPVGVFEHFPHRAAQLPPKWYSVNGDRFSVTSPQGKVLKGLSAEFKSDWGITESSGMINVPNIKQSDGRTAMLKPINGTSRQVGSVEQDMQRRLTGTFFSRPIYNAKGALGAVYKADGTFRTSQAAGDASTSPLMTNAATPENISDTITFDSGRQVPTGSENTVLNVGVTLAIYLGV